MPSSGDILFRWTGEIYFTVNMLSDHAVAYYSMYCYTVLCFMRMSVALRQTLKFILSYCDTHDNTEGVVLDQTYPKHILM